MPAASENVSELKVAQLKGGLGSLYEQPQHDSSSVPENQKAFYLKYNFNGSKISLSAIRNANPVTIINNVKCNKFILLKYITLLEYE